MGIAKIRAAVSILIVGNYQRIVLIKFLKNSVVESALIYWALLKIALPLLIIIRLLDEHFNIIHHIGEWLSPIMAIVGLPGQAAVVWATAIFLQLYAAMLVLASLWTQLELTAAQATVLALMMLVAHALPVELRIVQKTGIKLRAMLLIRIGGALAMGFILSQIYQAGQWLQYPATLHFIPPPDTRGWGDWFWGQLQNWTLIYIIIIVLVMFIQILKITHAEKILILILSPFLRRMGIGERATTIALVGMTLGLSYGGGLFIRESQKAEISRKDMLCAMTLLCLCHSVIEDTLAMMLVGAHISGALFARVIFSFIFMVIFAAIIKRMPDDTLGRIMFRP